MLVSFVFREHRDCPHSSSLLGDIISEDAENSMLSIYTSTYHLQIMIAGVCLPLMESIRWEHVEIDFDHTGVIFGSICFA